MSTAISPDLFYKKVPKRRKLSSTCSKHIPIDVFKPKRFLRISGPTGEWQIFSRQKDAITFAKDFGEGLMSFAFQRSDGTRGFLAAHPVVFWWYDSRKKPCDRRTFEVIPENEPCKLYLDLEFDRSLNPERDGVRMTNTFISVLCTVLKREFNIDCDRSKVLDLDSTTDLKFSRHLIFQIDKTCFLNNYHVGSFVRMVCHEIRAGHLFMLPPEALKELFVQDKKNNLSLFCDEGVYTKNRHFRLFQSTKWNKNTPLVVSAENKYAAHGNGSEKSEESEPLFLDSLVTHTTHCRERILEMGNVTSGSYSSLEGSIETSLPNMSIKSDMSQGSSPVPVVDKFIQELVLPGYVRNWVYFIKDNTLHYDIAGNRYCHNIGRAHKSNNVKYVVDMKKGVYYQKCYDTDCAGYRSPETKLPDKICFLLDDYDGSEFGGFSELSDSDLTEVWDCVNALLQEESQSCTNTDDSNKNFPDFGLSDEDLVNSSMDIKNFPDFGLSDEDLMNSSMDVN